MLRNVVIRNASQKELYNKSIDNSEGFDNHMAKTTTRGGLEATLKAMLKAMLKVTLKAMLEDFFGLTMVSTPGRGVMQYIYI